jgi:hypothetical protein
MTLLKHTAFVLLASVSDLAAQVNGNVSVPGTYSTLAAAFAGLNNSGTSSGVTVHVAAGYTENIVPGGFTLSASGTATSPIIVCKSGVGPNPKFFSYTGTRTPGSATQDGCLRLVGCDHVTIEGLDFIDNNSTNPATMEFGICFFKADPADGCQHNVIRNCNIRLSRQNNASGSGPAADGSRGIELVNAMPALHNASLVITASSGSHAHNTICSNTIAQCNVPVACWGFNDTPPYAFADHHNEIGKVQQGNQILNFGGGGTVSAACGVRIHAQHSLSVSGNVINSNNGYGSVHATILRGIHCQGLAGSDISLAGNTITLHGGSASSQLSAIEIGAGSGSSNTISVYGNFVTGCSNVNAVSGLWYGITCLASPAMLDISANRFTDNSTGAQSGSAYMIHNSGAPLSCAISNNTVGFCYTSQFGGSFYGIFNNGGAAECRISGNRLQNVAYLYPGTGNLYFISNASSGSTLVIEGNQARDLVLNHTGNEYYIHNSAATGSVLTVCNNTLTNYQRTAPAGSFYGYYSALTVSNCAITYTGNLLSNVTAGIPGTGSFYGVYNADAWPSVKSICRNRVTGVSVNGSGNLYGIYLDDAGYVLNGGSEISCNYLSDLDFTDAAYGIYIAGNTSSLMPLAVNENSIVAIASASSNAFGALLGGTAAQVFRNRIHGIETGATASNAYGIYTSGNGSVHAANNLISSVSALNATGTNRSNGIYLSSSARVTLDFNSVFMHPGAVSGNAGTNALYAFTGASLTLRNNILVNLAVASGTSIATAYRRSGSALVNYLPASGNNLFYAGVPSSSRVIFHNGSSHQQISTYKNLVAPRDSGSVTGAVSFLSKNPLSPVYLHISPSAFAAGESGATAVSAVTLDCDSDIRQGTTGYSGSGSAPDIGADEFNSDTVACSGISTPVVTALTPSVCAGENATLVATQYQPGSNLSFQWKTSTSVSGPFTVVGAGAGSQSAEFVTPYLNAGVIYYALETTCITASLNATSAVLAVSVIPVPTSSASVSNATACTGQTVMFTGGSDQGNSGVWFGPAGFSRSEMTVVTPVSGTVMSGVYHFRALYAGCLSPLSTVALTVIDFTADVVPSAHEVCAGQSVTVQVNSAPATYSWNGIPGNSIAVLTPSGSAITTVVVTGTNGCSVVKNVSVSVIHPTIAAVNAIVCDSGTAVLSVHTFTGSLVYWYASASASQAIGSGLQYTLNPAATATLFAGAVGNTSPFCSSARIPVTATLALPPTLTLAAQPPDVCPGGSCMLTVAGALQYSWSAMGGGNSLIVKPMAATSYSVNGWNLQPCTSSATIAVLTRSLPVTGAVVSAGTICPSSPCTFTATGAQTYTWSTGSTATLLTVNPALYTVYSVTGSATNGCSASHTLAVATKSLPAISVSTSQKVLCKGESVTFTANGGVSYTWLPGNSHGPVASFILEVPGVYNVIGTAVNGCTNVGFAHVDKDACAAVSNYDFPGLQLYPVPANQIITVNSGLILTALDVYDAEGRHVLSTQMNSGFAVTDISGLAPGFYVLITTTATGKNLRRSLPVQR